jgi:hypothetical protein
MSFIFTHLLIEEKSLNASFEAFTAVMIQVEAFWVVMPCGEVVGY